MTAEKLDIMVKAMRTKNNKLNTRIDVENMLFCLYKGLKAIGRNELASELIELYADIDSIDTNELVKMGTFK